jgi:hypothetical protein
MAYGRAEQAIVLWLVDEGNCENEKNGVHKTKTYYMSHT